MKLGWKSLKSTIYQEQVDMRIGKVKKEIVPIWRTLQKAYIGNKEIAISSPATFENVYYDSFLITQ